MKNLSLVLNAVLFVAVIALYYMHFSAPKCSNSNGSVATENIISGEAKSTTIVHVNMDSIQKNYKFYKDIEVQIAQNQRNAQSELETRTRSFQEKYAALAQKVEKHTITRKAAEAAEKQLMQEQQELQRLEYDMSNKLMNDQAVMTKDLYDSISSYLNFYNSKFGYQYIFGYSEASALLYADKGLDITDDILKGLNTRYEGEK